MTQSNVTTQDTIPAEPVPAEPEPKPEPKEAEPEPRTYGSIEEVIAEIADRAYLDDPADVHSGAGRGAHVAWEQPDGKMMIVRHRQPSPFDSNSLVFAIFHDEDEVRVYSIPKEKGNITRHHLSKRGRTFVVEIMADVEQLIDEMEIEIKSAEGSYAADQARIDWLENHSASRLEDVRSRLNNENVGSVREAIDSLSEGAS